jgi:hypothetical protein
MLFTVNCDRTTTGYANEEHFYLVVDVLGYAASCPETHQVGVEFTAFPNRPERPSCPATEAEISARLT